MSASPYKKIKESVGRMEQHQADTSDLLSSPEFRVSDKVRSEFDMWVWIYQEIANIRMEVSRLGVLVRINNVDSPRYLVPYHAHIWSYLIPVSVVIPQHLWGKVESFWNELKNEIDTFSQVRKNIPNKKIPAELIQKLDRLYRVALIAAQRAGLGFKVTSETDFESAIEKAITVS